MKKYNTTKIGGVSLAARTKEKEWLRGIELMLIFMKNNGTRSAEPMGQDKKGCYWNDSGLKIKRQN